MVNFGPLAAEIGWWVWGTPANFNGFRVLACSVTARHSSSGRQPYSAALNRGHHLYSAGRHSRWALTNILVIFIFCDFSALTLLVGRQEGHSACKNWVVRYWRGYLSGARCKWLAYGPAGATAIPSSLAAVKSRKFWCRLIQVFLEKRPLNGRSYFLEEFLSDHKPWLKSVKRCLTAHPSLKPW